MPQHPFNSDFYVRVTVRYHQPLGALDGTHNHYVRLQRFPGMDDADLILAAIARFRERGDRWHRIESVNLYPGRWDSRTAVAIDENDQIAGPSGDAA
jgi:hypothetical protein